LTSTVFGTLFTAGDAGQAVLQAWLSRARPADPATPAWSLPGGHLDYWFWPRLREAEPDVVLEVGATLIVVEAKFHSGKSGGATAPPNVADTSVATSSGAPTSDQLLREWRSVRPDGVKPTPRLGSAVTSIQDAIARCEQRALIYLVKRSHAVKADRELAASLAAAGTTSPRPSFYLLHWEHLDEVLTSAAAAGAPPRWQQELRAYLRHRGGRGVSRLRRHASAWPRSHGAPLDVARNLAAYAVALAAGLLAPGLTVARGARAPREPILEQE
jgi:hypothetical protein